MYKKSIFSAFFLTIFLLTAACAHDDGNHPAHEMGERADRVTKENSDAYQESRENAEQEGNRSHPAHEMDEIESVEKRGN